MSAMLAMSAGAEPSEYANAHSIAITASLALLPPVVG